jgi:hypothetical protein
MAVRHKLRHQILEDRINNPENSWSSEYIYKPVDITYLSNEKNWTNLSQNPKITWDIILNNLDKPWKFRFVGLNKNITWQNIIDNLDYQWDWILLTAFKPITWSIIKPHLDLFKNKLEWNIMSHNFDFEILKNLGLTVPWNFQNLSRSNIINWDIVIKYKNQNWNWDCLSESENLDYNIIVKHINKPWNWDKISLNLKITSVVLFNLNNHNWDWTNLSYNKSITEEILINYPDKPWNYACLSSSRNSISKEFILNNPDKPWNYDMLGYNNIIIKDKITDWSMLSQNLDLSFEFIKENIDKFIRSGNWFFLSINNNLTYELLNNNRNLPWNWGGSTVL